MDIKLKNLKQEYMGRCNIIPCCDLPKIEGSFNDLKYDGGVFDIELGERVK